MREYQLTTPSLSELINYCQNISRKVFFCFRRKKTFFAFIPQTIYSPAFPSCLDSASLMKQFP
jgi:hypothetical protein